jgi:hypothetical protein
MIELGDKVKDRFTKLEGTAVARCTYIFGCTQIQVQPYELKDGAPIDTIWVDEPQLDVIKKKDDVFLTEGQLEEERNRLKNYGGVRSHP